jgi:hypothetical protein
MEPGDPVIRLCGRLKHQCGAISAHFLRTVERSERRERVAFTKFTPETAPTGGLAE